MIFDTFSTPFNKSINVFVRYVFVLLFYKFWVKVSKMSLNHLYLKKIMVAHFLFFHMAKKVLGLRNKIT